MRGVLGVVEGGRTGRDRTQTHPLGLEPFGEMLAEMLVLCGMAHHNDHSGTTLFIS